jgi:hypothetical protein
VIIELINDMMLEDMDMDIDDEEEKQQETQKKKMNNKLLLLTKLGIRQ